jgi:hypothetical protein
MKTNMRNFFIFSILLIMVLFVLAVSQAVASSTSPPLAVGAASFQDPPKFDLIEFLKTAAIIFAPLMTIVFGIVNYIGKFGVQGKWQLISSLLAGLILGSIVMYFTIGPASAVGWFSVALFGLLVGLAASGCYEGIKTASAKGAGEKIDLDLRLPK